MRTPNLWIALDVPTLNEAENLMGRYPGHRQFKVGLELFLGIGPERVRRWTDQGFQIFLDLKLHDIPTTVRRALTQIVQLGVSLTTVHASGGLLMLEEAHQAGATAVVAVTVLTSLGDQELSRLGWTQSGSDWVSRLASLSKAAHLSGVVARASEIERIKTIWPDARIVVPGLRWGAQGADDHAHVMDPYQAWKLGATDLVIGRSLTRDPDPNGAYETLQSFFKGGCQ